MPTMTAEELDQLAEQTVLQDMEQLTPAPKPEPTKESGPMAWRARGGWLYQGRCPLEFGRAGDGQLLLEMRAMTDRAPDRQELSDIREKYDDAARAAVMAELQADPCWQQFIEAKSEVNSVSMQIEKAEEQIRKLEEERTRLAAKPRGQGSRLAAIAKETAELAQKVNGLRLEISALEPIHHGARESAKSRIQAIAMSTAQRIRQEAMQDLDRTIADFLAKNSETLTQLCAHMQARQGRNYDSWIAELRTFMLGRLERAEPMLDPANA